MKKLVLISIIAILASFHFTDLSAQYAIPTYELELSGTTITFEEEHLPNATISEERDMIIRTTDTSSMTVATTKVLIYNLETQAIYGPYSVIEDVLFEFSIDANEWGVKVIEYSTLCKLSVWIE